MSDPSRIVYLPNEYNLAVHQSVSLHCRAEGTPDPSFTWTPCKDVCNKSTLIIPEVWNDGVYNCTVTNILGSDSGSTKVGKLTINSLLETANLLICHFLCFVRFEKVQISHKQAFFSL